MHLMDTSRSITCKISITGDVNAKYQDVALQAIAAVKRTHARYIAEMSWHILFMSIGRTTTSIIITLSTFVSYVRISGIC